MSNVELTTAMTMGSLFDGIGGFPLAAARFGINTVWASEIEAFPIEVTLRRFPSMAHKGDITKLSGKLLFPVDIICGGSPCQDLSVAGARAGLSGARSGLFMEQIRIIKEMRTAERERGRTGVQIRPRYMAWENVPGAFSSGSPKGEDFRIVLEEILRVYDGSATIPRPFPYPWHDAGEIRVEGAFSLAWRCLDAQFWGVAQRRKALIITSNQQLCQDIEDSLQGLSLEFHHADGYMQALSMVARYHYILVVMDLSFSEISGVDLIRRMRELEQTPILVLSTHATSSEEVETLNAGADRYLAFDHPLDTERCLANAAAIMRRSLTTDTKCYASILISGSGLKINFNLRKAFLDGQDLKLTPKEFAVLCNLARHMGEVVTKEQLYQDIWENDYDTSPDATLKFHVKELRKKLTRSGAGDLIETAWGIGYILHPNPDTRQYNVDLCDNP